MTFRGGAVVFMFLLVGSAGFPQGNHSRRVPQFVYGRWAITKFVEVAGHAAETKELAQAQIGKSLRIGVHSFDHDSKFLWFDDTCKNVRYKMKETEGEDGSLAFYGLEQDGTDQYVVVNCNNRDSYFLEVAKNQELAVYYDGWIFFLRSQRGHRTEIRLSSTKLPFILVTVAANCVSARP